ncbi:CehA/McbA family metallohydrolase [Candidatus Viridilinea mediisalina]|uniref:Phosphotransferase n=1 Tax=Candidatus Viridilinea mediisalina TaxID=2024553 RepID=A0A2A6RMZ5_9CHLR|nr:CehA/McbA family metallohydrolase [Candidatus Viridilinea mediisalina]PDW04239.1 phosphotransferase [Candidatus Viridilinea mediisalina]
MGYTFCYPGALHIHTRYSDGTGSFPEVIAAARAAGLRWIIVTDHDTQAGASFAGWHNGLLVIVGHEITPEHNHFLALGLNTVVDPCLPPQAFLDQVYAQGGFGIIAHPDERVANRFKEIYRWDDWQIDGPTQREGCSVGLELWNLMSDWSENLTSRNRVLNYFVPTLGLSGPTPATLAWWDRLNMSGRRTFGVGGVDAHAFKYAVPWGEVEIFPYRWLFRTLTNYLLLHEPFSSDATTATAQVYAALGQGRSYFINRLEASAPPLLFSATRGSEWYGMGDSATLGPGPLTISADVGQRADVRLIANGKAIATARRQLHLRITTPAVYRLEAYLGARAWLFSNPIYVTA